MTCQRCGAALTLPEGATHPVDGRGKASCRRGGPHRPDVKLTLGDDDLERLLGGDWGTI